MEITLHPETRAFIDAAIEAGEFDTPSDALNAAVAELRRRNEYRDYVRNAVAEGLASLERGQGKTFTSEQLREHFSEENIRARATAREVRRDAP